MPEAFFTFASKGSHYMNLYETRSQEWVSFHCLKPLWVSFHEMVSNSSLYVSITPVTYQVLTLYADFSGTERDRDKEEQVQTIKDPPLVTGVLPGVRISDKWGNSFHFSELSYNHDRTTRMTR